MFSIVNKYKLAVLKEFFIEPSLKISVRELSRRAKISIAWASKTVSEFQKTGILRAEKTGAAKLVFAGEENFRIMKRQFNLSSLYDSGLADFLAKELRPEAIVVFGSYEKGEDEKKSDIDIAVINGRQKSLDVSKFQKSLSRKINLHMLKHADSGDSHFRNSIANGNVLYGFLKVV